MARLSSYTCTALIWCMRSEAALSAAEALGKWSVRLRPITAPWKWSTSRDEMSANRTLRIVLATALMASFAGPAFANEKHVVVSGNQVAPGALGENCVYTIKCIKNPNSPYSGSCIGGGLIKTCTPTQRK
jgi:hypothetical protein